MARLSRVTRKLEESMEDSSNAAVDKAAVALEKLATSSSLLEDEIKDEIKSRKQSARDLARTTDRLESYSDKMIKAEKDFTAGLEAARKQHAVAAKAAAAGSATAHKERRKAQKLEVEAHRKLQAAFRECGLSATGAAARIGSLAKESANFKDAVKKVTAELNKPASKIGKGLDLMHSKVQTSISGLGKFSAVMALTKKAFSELYGQSIRLANKGLLGSMAQLNISALKLRMTAEEFEGLVSANRDMIALMGGGAQGIENFEKIISESAVGLEYMGKEGKKAAATIMAGFNRAGAGLMSSNKDISTAYQDSIKPLNKQFKMFQGLFGDTAEQFANLYEQQLKSEAIQARLIAGDGKSVALQMKEIMVRTETLKLMGLNNEQIIAMSKRVDALFNPKENRQGDAMTERIAAREALRSGAQEIKGQDPELAAKIEAFVKSGEAARFQQMKGEDKKRYMTENAELFKGINKMEEMIAAQRDVDGGDTSFKGYLFTDRMKAAGKEWGAMSDYGKDLNVAKAQGYDQTPEGRMKLAAKGFENVMSDVNGETTALGKAFGKLRDAVEMTTALFNNPFTTALTAIGAALLFSSTTIRGAVAGAAEAIMGTAKLMAGSITGFFKGLFGLLKKVPGLSAVFGGLEGAWDAYHTDTEDYYKRTGIEREATVVPQLAKDLGVRILGTLSDIGSSTMKAATLGMYDRSKDFADKQEKAKAVEGKTVPSAASLPNATKAPQAVTSTAPTGANGSIAKVISTAPGSNTVQRPDGTIEKVTGDRNWRNNNPGNIEAGPFAQRMGAIGSDGRFAIFPDYETGRKAKAALIFEGKNYKDLNLKDAISRYAPPSENNTGAYQASVLSAVGGANKRMGDYTEEERRKILDAMQKVEGFKAGKIAKVGEGAPTLATPPFAPPTIPPIISPQVPQQPGQAPVTVAEMSETQKRQALIAKAGQSQPTGGAGAGGDKGNVVSELEKQTGLLSTMVSLLSKPNSSKRGFQLDQQSGIGVAS